MNITKSKLGLVAIVAASMVLPSVIRADNVTIEVGDKPYYTHGPRYWEHDWEMVWAPGHWDEHHHHWIHGFYRKGEHRHHHDGD